MKTQNITISREQCAEEIRLYAEITNGINALDAAKNAEILATEAKYEAEIEARKKDLKAHAKLIEAWAMQNPSAFPKDKKSIDFPCGTIGHRTGTPTVKAIGGWTLERSALKLSADGQRKFLAVKETVSKEAVLAAVRGSEVSADWLRSYGIQIAQTERFFIDPKLEKTETADAAL